MWCACEHVLRVIAVISPTEGVPRGDRGAPFFFTRRERRKDVGDDDIFMGCMALLFLLGLPGMAVMTLVICVILANLIPPM